MQTVCQSRNWLPSSESIRAQSRRMPGGTAYLVGPLGLGRINLQKLLSSIYQASLGQAGEALRGRN